MVRTRITCNYEGTGEVLETSDALLEVESVISVEKSDISKLNVVGGHRGIPNRDRNKAPAIAVGEILQE